MFYQWWIPLLLLVVPLILGIIISVSLKTDDNTGTQQRSGVMK